MKQAVESYWPRHSVRLHPVQFSSAVLTVRLPLFRTIRALAFAGMLAAAPPVFAQHGSGGGHSDGGGGGGFSSSHSSGGEASYSGGSGSHSSSQIAGASRGARGGTQSDGRFESVSVIGEKHDTGSGGAIRRFFGFSHLWSATTLARPIFWPRCPFSPGCYGGSAPPIFYGGYAGFYPALGFGYGFGCPLFWDSSNYPACIDPALPALNCATTSSPAAMLLYMNDGSAADVTDYWANGGTFHYISQDGHEHLIPLTGLNIQRTSDANARLGFRFTLDRTQPGTQLDRIPESRGTTNLDFLAPYSNESTDASAPTAQLAVAMRSTAPLNALDVGISGATLHAATQTTDVIVRIGSKNLKFVSAADGEEAANLKVEAASLDQNGNVLAGKTETIQFLAPTQDPLLLPDGTWRIHVSIPMPSRAEIVRVTVEDQNGGQIGTANVNRATIEAAPPAGTPAPHVMQAISDSAI